jgi:hypothetical protein
MSDAGEIIKSGAADKLADIIHKLAGPMADEIGLLMADKIKVYRVKNWVNVVKKTQRILAASHLSPDAVPPRLFLPILEGSSVESDQSLQDLWAGLLATASEQADSLSPSFIETLKQLTPAEAKTLNDLFQFASTHDGFKLTGFDSSVSGALTAPMRLKVETFERLGLIRREYDLQEGGRSALDRFFRDSVQKGQLYNFSTSRRKGELPEITYEFGFTEYGVQFMKACRGPLQKDIAVENEV